MNIRHHLCVLFSFLLSISVFGMDVSLRLNVPSKRKLLFEEQPDEAVVPAKKMRLDEGASQAEPRVDYLTNNINGHIMDIIKNPAYKFFYADSFVVTHKGIIDALKQREKEGATVSFGIGRHGANIPVDLKNVKSRKDLHEKRLIACEKDPLLGSPGKNEIIEGSNNFSYGAYHNNERAVRLYNQKDLCLQAVNMHLSNSPAKSNKEVRVETPTKPHLDSSYKYALNQSEANRILSAAYSAEGNREVIVATMNLNDENITHALMELAHSGGSASIVVNDTALAGGRELLTGMQDAGVKVYVAKDHMQHAKLMGRKIGEEGYASISSGNKTTLGDSEINSTYGSPDTALADAVLEDQKKYIKEKCITLDEAIKKIDAQRALKRSKKGKASTVVTSAKKKKVSISKKKAIK